MKIISIMEGNLDRIIDTEQSPSYVVDPIEDIEISDTDWDFFQELEDPAKYIMYTYSIEGGWQVKDNQDTSALYYTDRNYPSLEEQLDAIYHQGLEVWKEGILAIKLANPKPEYDTEHVD